MHDLIDSQALWSCCLQSPQNFYERAVAEYNQLIGNVREFDMQQHIQMFHQIGALQVPADLAQAHLQVPGQAEGQDATMNAATASSDSADEKP